MGHIVIKPVADRDEYVYWSTIVEAPIGWGDRAEMTEMIESDARQHGGPTSPSGERMERTDRNGSSSLDGSYRWDDDELIYEQRGLLPRRDLYRACELLEASNEPAVWDLLKPFEDESEVRRG